MNGIANFLRDIVMPFIWLTKQMARFTRHHLWCRPEPDWADKAVYGTIWSLYLIIIGGGIIPLPLLLIAESIFKKHQNAAIALGVIWFIAAIVGIIVMLINGWDKFREWGYFEEDFKKRKS